MKNILLFVVLFTSTIFAGFNFNQCSGSGAFKQQINHYHGDYENAITVGEIPQGIQGLEINLISDKDVDIRLYAENGDKIVHWPYGILHGAIAKTKPYKNVDVSYSGYNGVSGEKGHEYIKISNTTPTKMIMKAFGYKAGYATVNYSWTGKEDCNGSQNGSGEFTQNILQNKTNLVGEIPAGINNVFIELTSENDIDIQLYGQDGTAIVSWKPRGLLSGSDKDSINYHDMDIEWSGYNGTNGQKGHEYIKISSKTSENLTMKVFGYRAGDANVTYSWGEIQGCTKEYLPVCALVQVDDNCNPGEACIDIAIAEEKTYNNLCESKLEGAEFLHEGVCKTTTDHYESTLYIKEDTVICNVYTIGETKYSDTCLQVKEDINDTWAEIKFNKSTNIDSIGYAYITEDFNYSEHYKYKLKVDVTVLPSHDETGMPLVGPEKIYKVLQVLDKELVESPNLNLCTFCTTTDNSLPENEICNLIDCMDENSTICSTEYKPVCGEGPSSCSTGELGTICTADIITLTHTNMCHLEKAYHSFLYDGECKSTQHAANADYQKYFSLWNTQNIHDYSFMGHTKTSDAEAVGNVEVLNDNISSLIGINGFYPKNANLLKKTIPDYFSLIKNMLQENNSNYTCEYDETYGFPTFLQIVNNDMNTTTYTLTDFKVLNLPVCGTMDYTIDEIGEKITDCWTNQTGCSEITYSSMHALEKEDAAYLSWGACKKTDKVESIYISENIPQCFTIPCPTYFTKKVESAEWENFHNNIKGFTPKPHYRYKLSVKITNIPNPPADASSVEYTLLQILEETLIEPNSCPTDYAPVCGVDTNGWQKSFMNLSELLSSSYYSLLHDGHCQALKGPMICTDDCPGAEGINAQCETVSACNACGLGSSIVITNPQGYIN